MMRRKTGKILLMAACAALIAGLFADPAWAQDGRFRGRFGGGHWQQQRQERLQQGDGQQGQFGQGRREKLREKLREELKNMPPEQRRQKIEELRKQFQERREERHQAFEDKWSKASPEQRAKFCEGAAQRCASDANSPGCMIAQKTCAGRN